MRKIATSLALASWIVLASCGGAQDSAKAESSNMEKSPSVRTATSARTNTEPVRNRSKKTRNRSNDDYSENLREMYTALNMTNDQIKTFESQWRREVDTWRASNRNSSMNHYERVEKQDRILKDILDESQFEEYQQWAREHANDR